MKYNPADPTHHIEARIFYSLDGSIHSNDQAFNQELNDVLNLNLVVMKNHRKSAVDAVVAWWTDEKRRLQGAVPRDVIERVIERHKGGHGSLLPYCRIGIWWLEQKLGRRGP